jgi:hypothetical protein
MVTIAAAIDNHRNRYSRDGLTLASSPCGVSRRHARRTITAPETPLT